eukprot:UN20450
MRQSVYLQFCHHILFSILFAPDLKVHCSIVQILCLGDQYIEMFTS